MPEWIVERGIGETRSALVDSERILEARIAIDEIVPAGARLRARLTAVRPRALATDEKGNEYLLTEAPRGVAEGSSITLEVTRSAIPGAEPWKRPLARVSEDEAVLTAPGQHHMGTLPATWDDLIEEARSGLVRFNGGELRISPTPAMTLIDVDGYLPPQDLAVRGTAEAAKAIRRLDIGGSIGLDLPTIGSKTVRQAAGSAIDVHLPQPFERTAVNGFGFVQIVRPRLRASLVELAQDRALFEARGLLRRAVLEPPGPKRLVVHPAVHSVLETHPGWLDQLAGQVGGAISLRTDTAIPMSGGYVEPA